MIQSVSDTYAAVRDLRRGSIATVAEFPLDPHEFSLGTVFAELPAVTASTERVLADANGVVPYFWVQGTETGAIVEQFSNRHKGIHVLSPPGWGHGDMRREVTKTRKRRLAIFRGDARY